MQKWALAGAAALLLAGCNSPAPQNLVDDLGDDMVASCGAEDLQNLIGQPKAVLETMRFSQRIRVITPGMAVTMDFAPNRLNIHVSDAGIITALRCG